MAYGFKILLFCWSFSSNILAVKGLRVGEGEGGAGGGGDLPSST